MIFYTAVFFLGTCFGLLVVATKEMLAVAKVRRQQREMIAHMRAHIDTFLAHVTAERLEDEETTWKH